MSKKTAKELELERREKELERRELEVTQREKVLDPLSQAIQDKKEGWYDKVKLSVRQMDVIIWITTGLLILVFLLIGLDAAGIFKPFG